ncbi:glycosyl transferase family 1 [Flavobacteriaceae bacterium F89]|uniref:Glycosyl transferase family 1 n=1 Tax=Cerina litoralis TaxID=2874477 RepID=A0AAE3JPT0_9FLAO|nr:glycosyl transferase family 1 [Cerina litoralis]MCG2461371.1 glycosyl transferase family 1 [Cerina litoralis]
MKKVLIITYYWPPAGGPGVQRWLNFVRYLRDFGVEPVLYIPENPHYPIVDKSFLEEIPNDIKIYKGPIFEPYRLAGLVSRKKTNQISSGIIDTKNQSFLEKAMLWVRGNLFIPDARKFWVKPSVRYLSEILRSEGIKTITTTGPPHSVHLIGYRLKQEYRVQWLADFRDPWTSIGYHEKLKLTKAARQKHQRLERMVLNTADRITVTSLTTKNEFEAVTSRPIEVITNGYQEIPVRKEELDDKFTISHIGSLLTGRNPKNLWKVLSELISENVDFKNAVQLRLAGIVSKDVLETLAGFDLEPYLKLEGYLSHSEALKVQRKSQILLLAEIDSKETKGIIPGKLFEYMAAGRPILGLGPKGWEVGTLIAETQSGKTFDYQEHSQIKKLLLEWFADYQQGKLTVTSVGIEKYSRRALTEKLVNNLPWE